MTILRRYLLAGNCGGMSNCALDDGYTSRILHPLVDHFDAVLSLGEAFVFLQESLIRLCQIHFFLSVWEILELLKDLESFSVCTIKNLLLLEVHLNSGFIWKVHEGLFEFDEFLHAREIALHSLQRLVNRSSNFLKITHCGPIWPRSLIKMIGRVRLAIEMAVLMYVLLAKRLLMLHAKGIDWHVMLVAVEHARLLLW